MANWWDEFPQAPTGPSVFAPPPQAAPVAPPSVFNQGLAGIPLEVRAMMGMAGPEKALGPMTSFLTRAPIEIMGPNGPMLVDPGSALGQQTAGTALGFRKENRETQGQQFDQGMRTRQFTLEQQKALDARAQGKVLVQPDGRLAVNPAVVDADRATADAGAPLVPVIDPVTRQITLVRREAAVGRQAGEGLSPGDKDVVRAADDVVVTAANSRQMLAKALELSGKAFEGPLSRSGVIAGRIGGNVFGMNVPQTQATTEFTTIMGEEGLNRLRAVFGGNPTEGERKILLDLQAAADMTRQERDALLRRAIEAVDRRLAVEQDKAQQLRTGGYYRPGYTPSASLPEPYRPGSSAPAPGTVTAPMPGAPPSAPAGGPPIGSDAKWRR